MVKKADRKKLKHSGEKKVSDRAAATRSGASVLSPVDRVWAGMVASLFVLLPLVVSTSGFESFDIPKNAFLWISVALLSVLGLLAGKLRLPSSFHMVDIFLLITAGYLFFHTLISGRFYENRTGILSVIAITLLYFILRTISSGGFHRGLWLAIAVSISLNAVFTVLQQFDMFPLMAGSGRADASDRLVPAGFIGEVNRGGFLFALTLIILLYFLFSSSRRKKGQLVFAAGLAALILIGLLFSRTMTSILGLAACLALWFVFQNWFMVKKQEIPVKKLVVFWLIIVLGLAGISAVGYKAGVVDRVKDLADFTDVNSWVYASSGRTPMFYLTWKMIQESPLAGRGLNSFPVEFFKYKTETETGRNVRLMPQPGAFKEAHNEYLQTWLELGLAGLFLLLLMFLLPLYFGIRALFSNVPGEDKYWMAVLLLGLVFTGITCLAFFPLHLAVTAPYICLVVAQIVLFSETNSSIDELKGSDQKRILKIAWIKYGLSGFIVLFASLAVYCGVNTWQVNKKTGMASYILTRSMREQLQPRQKLLIIKEALRILDEAEEKNLQLPEIQNLKGTAFLISGRYRESADSFKAAIRLSPSPEAYINLAASCLALGDENQAVQSFNTARAYDTRNLKVLQMMFHMWEQEILDREQSLGLVEALSRTGTISPRRRKNMLEDMLDRGLISRDEVSGIMDDYRSSDDQ